MPWLSGLAGPRTKSRSNVMDFLEDSPKPEGLSWLLKVEPSQRRESLRGEIVPIGRKGQAMPPLRGSPPSNAWRAATIPSRGDSPDPCHKPAFLCEFRRRRSKTLKLDCVKSEINVRFFSTKNTKNAKFFFGSKFEEESRKEPNPLRAIPMRPGHLANFGTPPKATTIKFVP